MNGKRLFQEIGIRKSMEVLAWGGETSWVPQHEGRALPLRGSLKLFIILQTLFL